MTKKRIKYPIHKLGKHLGYEEFEDGSIKPAPTLYDQIDKAMEDEQNIKALLDVMIERVHQLYSSPAERMRHFWKRIEEEYGLKSCDEYQLSYNKSTKIISKISSKQD